MHSNLTASRWSYLGLVVHRLCSMQQLHFTCSNIHHQCQPISSAAYTLTNVVSGCDTEQEAVQYFLESRSLMNLSRFNLHTWASNSPSLRDLAQQHSIAEMQGTIKMLGLCWNIGRDELSLYSRPELATCTPVTKCEILCYTSSIFDPLGLVTPVTITAKLLFQEL